MAANPHGELNQDSQNGVLHNAILTGDAMRIRNILKSCSASSPLHSLTGLPGNGHSQHLATLPIHLAAIHRKVQSLEILLHSGADPEKRDHRGYNALHLVIAHWPRTTGTGTKPCSKFERSVAAAAQQAESCLRLLCSFGVDVNTPVEGGSGDTPVHLAVRYGALPAVALLSCHGANLDAADRQGMRPLHMAAGTLNTDMAAVLLRHGADVNQTLARSGATALHMAVVEAACRAAGGRPVDPGCVRELLEHGADPDARDKAGWTPLHRACQDGLTETADALLAHGADVNVRTPRGENCLFLFLDRAANIKRTRLLERLLGLTYPVRVTNDQGELPRALLLPQHRAQRDTLLQLCRQPLSLQDTCRVHIHRHYGERARLKLKERLPKRLHNFLYNCSVAIPFFGTHQSVDNETAADFPRTTGELNTVEAHASGGYT